MDKLQKRVAYLNGLTKGLNLNESSAEGKLLVNIVDVLESFAQEFNSVNTAQSELEEYVESIDEDLSYLEDEIFSESEEDEKSGGSAEDWIEMVCPNCRELITFAADILDEEDDVEVTCPYCNGLVYDNTVELIEDVSSFRRQSKRSRHPGI